VISDQLAIGLASATNSGNRFLIFAIVLREGLRYIHRSIYKGETA
jgi:hypothetical protein